MSGRDKTHHDDDHVDNNNKEKKRNKMFKKMGKLLGKAWTLTNAKAFQDGGIWNLSQVGHKLDQKDEYDNNGSSSFKHAWQSFATDLGSVYTTHIAT